MQRALRAAGVRRLDLVVATHQSRDHQGGLHAVLARIPTRLLLENGDGTRDPDFQRGCSRRPTRAGSAASRPAPGQVLRGRRPRGARARARRRAPPGAPPPEDPEPARRRRDRAAPGASTCWLSADAESGAILPLRAAARGGDEGLPPRQRRPGPAGAAASACGRRSRRSRSARGNDYGHPAPSTLAALRAVPHVYRTDRDGTVVLRVAGGRMRVETGA